MAFLRQPLHFLNIFRDEREEFVVINMHLNGYFQITLVSPRRMNFGEIHPKQFLCFLLFQPWSLKKSFFFFIFPPWDQS